jgi:hypothetical protein
MCACKTSTGWERPVTLEKFLGPKSVIWTVDDVGVLILLLEAVPHVHAFFWDRRLRGREKLCRLAIQCLMRQFGLAEIWTSIPEGRAMVLNFASRIGFIPQTLHDNHIWMRTNAGDLHLAAGRDK